MKARTILVVEDDLAILPMISNWLTKQEYNIYAAPDTGTAIDLFKEHQNEIQLALIDVKLKYESGFDLADAIEKEFDFRDVVFMTAYFWEEETLEELLKRGKPFFEKPLKFEEEILPFLEKFFEDRKKSAD